MLSEAPNKPQLEALVASHNISRIKGLNVPHALINSEDSL